MEAGVLEALETAIVVVAPAVRGSYHELSDLELHDALALSDRLRRASEATQARVLAVMDARQSFVPEGAKTAATYAAWKLPIPLEQARALLRCGRQLRTMPAVAETFMAGAIGVDHVRLLAMCQVTNADAFAEAEPMLLDLAVDLDHHSFGRAVRYWCQLADPDGSERTAEKRYVKRRCTLRTAPDGMELLDAQLDPVTGGIVRTTFEMIKRELFEADWAEAKVLHGDATTIADLARSDAQRGADALQVMAERARMVHGTLHERHGQRPLITVVAGEATLANLCETEAGTILDPHDLLRLLDRAELERVVFDSPSRVIDVGVRRRLFQGATRRAVEVRDRECDHPSCHEPITDADIDHLIEYRLGGLTVQTNGKCKCKWHHRWRHHTDRPPPPAA